MTRRGPWNRREDRAVVPPTDEGTAAPTSGGSRRSRTLLIGIATGSVNRALTILTPIIVIPVSLQYLGASGYGAWALGLSITALLQFSDLGIGAGLMTRLGQLESHDLASARAAVSNAYAMVGAVVTLALVLILGSSLVVPWADVLGASGGDDGPVEPILLVTLAAFVAGMMTALVVRAQFGVGQQGRANVWQAGGSLLTIAAVFGAARIEPGRVEFVVAASFAPVLVGAVNTAVFFVLSDAGRRLRPQRSLVDLRGMLDITALGGKFLVITLLLTVTSQCDLWIASRVGGIDAVADYAVPFRVTSVVAAVGLMLSMPLWPLHAQAVASGDVQWVRSVTRKMLAVNVAALGALSVALTVAAPSLVDAWLGGAVTHDRLLWGGLALWWFVQNVVGPLFMVQNGAEVLAPQTIGYLALTLSIPAKVVAASTVGTSWMPWVGVLCFVGMIWPACCWGYQRALLLVESNQDAATVAAVGRDGVAR